MSSSPPDAHAAALLDLLHGVRDALDGFQFPLDLPGADDARTSARAARAQLDDYIIPRLGSLEAPLLAVVGGSTGAGKSTLVNALVGHPVTRSGVIRPTTRQPILLHHPAEGHWFAGRRVLPTLSRTRGVVVVPASQPDGTEPAVPADRVGPPSDAAGAGTLVLLADPMVPPGIAVLDAPDIDSIADENRRLAAQLLAAADLWLFVTTANRYADAVPWKLLADASARDILLAVVLDRVPPGVEEEVRGDLHTLLSAQQLGHAPIFTIPESALDALGMLPDEHVEPIKRWLSTISADADGRREIARRTLNGAVRSLALRLYVLSRTADAQEAAARRFEAAAASAYDGALAGILDATRDGTLLRGEVLARWQDFVGTGELMRGLETGIGRIRDRIGSFFTGTPTRAVTVETAIESGLHAVMVEEAARAAEKTERAWREDAAGKALLHDPSSGPQEDFSEEAAREIRAWQKDLLDLISEEGADKRFAARMLSFGVNGLTVALMVVVFASTGGLSGLEIGIAGGSAVVGQKLLEAVFGEDAVRRLAKSARANLQIRCRSMLDRQVQGYTRHLEPLRSETRAETIRALASRLEASAARMQPGDSTAQRGAEAGPK